ncbi:N-glycosylase/DNA lyase [Thermoproteota archaeon]
MKRFNITIMQPTFHNQKGIKEFADTIKALQLDTRIKKMVDERMEEFRMVHEMDTYKWYEELVYCLLTAYSSALMGQKCVDALSNDNVLLEGSKDDIRECLVDTGHRFPNKRAEFIYNTQYLAPIIKKTIQGFKDSKVTREWLVENIKGLGWKEASHYLRNIGYFDLAIIDRHIINNLREYRIIELDPNKGLKKKRYLSVEETLNQLADEVGLQPGELDLYMWYRKTGKVLK